MILPSSNDHDTPQTVLAYCLALDAYAHLPIETVRQALHEARVPPLAAYDEWKAGVERALTLIHPSMELTP